MISKFCLIQLTGPVLRYIDKVLTIRGDIGYGLCALKNYNLVDELNTQMYFFMTI